MENNTRVTVNNSGSAFRGLIGTVVRMTPRGLYEVRFDAPFFGHETSLFFEHELQTI